ncbi:MAG TPA: nucleotidyl transferase AbiEii/AbiGii toxin family protein [Clostridia bacterium]|nr:nucleotidyl transferase AbiEii/AbiGii toxin family protein [Clostridia bacterium]
MIHENTFTNEWIQKISEDYKLGKKRADPALIEKVTKALYLLECLAKTNLKFIFKGGTSLLLLLNEMHRFSIDIDIIIEEHKNKVDMDIIVSEIVERSFVFTRFEENVRKGNHRVPKAHCKFIKFKKPEVHVNMPSADCILGDKLTAYAPNTTGIPYGKNKELEIIKQLFDVGNLFDAMENIDMVSKTFKLMAAQELVYRDEDKKYTYQDVLNDIFETSRILSERGRIEKEIFNHLQTGVNRIKDYIFSENYILESAVNSAAKAAYLSLLIKYNLTEVERFDKKIDLRTLVITNPDFNKFKTIMKFDPEAYFYWYKSIEIISNNIS